MGAVLESTKAMGEYSVEVRSESFYLSGEWDNGHGSEPPRHSISVYPDRFGRNCGTIEILLEDIPKIRAALDLIEEYKR